MKHLLLATFFVAGSAQAKPPACAHWPTTMALATLKNAGITDPTKIAQNETKAVLLAAEPLGKEIYREVYDITYQEKAGKIIEVITSNKASDEECSLSNVEVFVVSQHLGQ